MKFLISVIDGHTASATPAEMEAIGDFNDGLKANGHFLFAGGLAAPSAAVVIDNRAGVHQLSHGPLLSGAEHYSGCWIINADSEQIAMELAIEGSRCCNRKVELRPFLD